jgi:hypothetical protein
MQTRQLAHPGGARRAPIHRAERGSLVRAQRASRVALGREALTLRRRLLALLADPTAEGDPGWHHGVSAEVWRFVLRAECCAIPLGEFLRRRNLLSALGAPVSDALRTAELSETQRVLAARTTLDLLDDIGARLGVSIVAIKGSALAAAPAATALDQGDVDVLIAPSDVERVWRALTERGWTPAGGASGPGAASDANHLHPLVPPGAGLPVELHHRASYGGQRERLLESEPVPGRAALRRLTPRDAVELLLRHSVIAHPYRRGHLRDLFLLATELSHLDPAERTAVDVDLATDPYAPELREMLEMGEAIRAGAASVPSIASEPLVAWKYATLLKLDWVVTETFPGWLSVGQIPLERADVRRLAVRAHLRDALGPVPPGSRFHPGWSERVPAPLRGLGGRIARAGWRFALLVLLAIFGSRVLSVVSELLAPRRRSGIRAGEHARISGD